MYGAGSQYCCWNSDSTLVALSSDFYQAVMVFDVQRKQQVGCCSWFNTSTALCFALTVLLSNAKLLLHQMMKCIVSVVYVSTDTVLVV